MDGKLTWAFLLASFPSSVGNPKEPLNHTRNHHAGRILRQHFSLTVIFHWQFCINQIISIKELFFYNNCSKIKINWDKNDQNSWFITFCLKQNKYKRQKTNFQKKNEHYKTGKLFFRLQQLFSRNFDLYSEK